MPSKTHRLADPISSEVHAHGEPDAPVTLVQYGDYADLRIMPISTRIRDQGRLRVSA
jgi:hypothetical protein